jgi:hypothetical protein
MAEMAPFTDATFKVQFRTALPTGDEDREAREGEHAALLNQIKEALHAAIDSSRTAGWEVALVEEASFAAPGSARPSG